MLNFSIRRIQKEIPKNSFDCGVPSINSKIEESYYPTILQSAYSFEAVTTNGITIGYYMLSFNKISLTECPETIKDYSSSLFRYYYSLELVYIAVNKTYQKRGVGTKILETIIDIAKKLSTNYPIRLITIDALKDKVQWYQDRGFSMFNKKDIADDKPTVKMFIDCISEQNKIKLKEYIKEMNA